MLTDSQKAALASGRGKSTGRTPKGVVAVTFKATPDQITHLKALAAHYGYSYAGEPSLSGLLQAIGSGDLKVIKVSEIP